MQVDLLWRAGLRLGLDGSQDVRTAMEAHTASPFPISSVPLKSGPLPRRQVGEVCEGHSERRRVGWEKGTESQGIRHGEVPQSCCEDHDLLSFPLLLEFIK